MTEPMTGMLMQLPDHVNSVHCEWNLVTTPPPEPANKGHSFGLVMPWKFRSCTLKPCLM